MAGKRMLKSMLSLLVCGLLFAIIPSRVYSEAVFLKNGTIAEGVITAEDDAKITLDPVSGEKITIPRSNILRILVHKRYKDQIYLTRTDGFTYEGFIVNEDNTKITLRTSLDSSKEINVPRDAVVTISRKKPSEKIIPAVHYSSVFLKDGEIIDCRIVREGIRFIEVSPFEGERRMDILVDVKIRFDKRDRSRLVLSMGSNIFRKGNRVELGSLAAAYGGGGHSGAASCSFPACDAGDIIAEITGVLERQ